MKYRRFEELPVWEAGVDMSVRIFTLTEDKAFRFKGRLIAEHGHSRPEILVEQVTRRVRTAV